MEETQYLSRKKTLVPRFDGRILGTRLALSRLDTTNSDYRNFRASNIPGFIIQILMVGDKDDNKFSDNQTRHYQITIKKKYANIKTNKKY